MPARSLPNVFLYHVVAAILPEQVLITKYKEIYGVDITKDVFDVFGSLSGHIQFKNTESGFKAFVKSLLKEVLFVMEATGYYHYRLAKFLDKNRIAVLVENLLFVKRFYSPVSDELRFRESVTRKTPLAKVKIDKSDAKAICEYAQMNKVLITVVLQMFKHRACSSLDYWIVI